MAGVTNTGFVVKRFPEVQGDFQTQAISLFQDVVPAGETVDVSDATLLGRLIGLSTPAVTEVWEAMQEVYSAFDPNSATGVALDNLVALTGITRKQETPTTFSAMVWGSTYTDIPANSVIRTGNTTEQYTNANGLSLLPVNVCGVGLTVPTVTTGAVYEVTIAHANRTITLSTAGIAGDTPDSILSRLNLQIPNNPDIAARTGSGILQIQAQQHYSSFNFTIASGLSASKVAQRLQFSGVTSSVPAPAVGTVTTIVTSVVGWDSVNNPVKATVPQAKETDDALRTRFFANKYKVANNTIDSLFSALSELTGVTDTRIYVNDTDSVNAQGLPPHSFSVLLLGGEDLDIAKTIWGHTPAGIASKGTTAVSVVTAQGQEQTVRFQRPVFVPLYVEIDLTTDSTYPSGGNDQIKANLVEYINNSQGIGGKVVYSRLFDAVNKTPGHEIVTLKIGTSAGSLSETTLTMAYNQIPTLALADITII